MSLIRNLSIKAKLSLLLFCLLVPLGYFSWISLLSELDYRDGMRDSSLRVDEAQSITKLVRSLQLEWSDTYSWLLEKNYSAWQEVENQRKLADSDLRLMEGKLVGGTGRSFLVQVHTLLLQTRNEIASAPLVEKSSEYREAYSRIIQLLSTEIDLASTNTFEKESKNQLRSIFQLNTSKEALSTIRFYVRNILQSGELNYKDYSDLEYSRRFFDYQRAKFESLANPESIGMLNAILSGEEASRALALVDLILEERRLDSLGMGLEEWYGLMLGVIDQVHEFEGRYINRINQEMEAKVKVANSRFNVFFTLTVLVILLGILLALFITRGISDGIALLREAADRIAKGNTDLTVQVVSSDEIGGLSESFNQIIESSRSLSRVAEEIGGGNYSTPVPLRGDKDELGRALAKMGDNLSRLSGENFRRNWLLEGNGGLSERLRGDKTAKQIANDVIVFLCEYMKMPIGGFFLKNNLKYHLVASYAYQVRKDNFSKISPGEGLIGQVILEQKAIIFSELPDDYIHLKSGLGSAKPRYVIGYPILFDSQVLAVIELGSQTEFTDQELDLLEMAAENIGISINSAISRDRLKELLEETQKQAEELEAQQEELKQTNEELQEKTFQLERSEAELKTQQEELQQTNEELEEKANLLEEQKEKLELTKMDLENKARELEVTSRYKSEFLANMSHELRTPLNSILILSQLLSENKNKVLGEKEIGFARNIYSSGADLLNLINEILDLSKVESGRMELNPEKVDFEAVKEDILGMFGELAKSREIEFELKNETPEGFVFSTDKQRLEQILRNLLSNAFKFTPKNGKIDLTVSLVANPKMFSRSFLNTEEKLVAFRVNDTGIGIPPDKQGIIFEAFQQVDGGTKRQYGGTGLGLSISRELAGALGGEIKVQSQEGVGSIFTLFLPQMYFSAEAGRFQSPGRREETGSIVTAPAHLPQEIPHTPELEDDRDSLFENDRVILIMEDDLAFAKILLDFVRERNYKGIVATQGNTGLNMARLYRPDAIMLDIKLPVLNGVEVLRQLKSDLKLRHIPVQIISGYDTKMEGLELGAFSFLQKPISRKDLTQAFERIEEFTSKKLKKLLIIEDNELQNKAILELVGNGDVKSVSALRGLEGLELMKKEKFDCIIIDLGLPDISGFELLEKIKADDTINQTPIIVYTGRELSREENKKLSKYANTVVLKTVSSHERLLDETMLFLHRVTSSLPKEKQNLLRNLHKTGEVLQGRKILVVDDDIRNIYSLTNVLEEEGMSCHTAENGKEAIELLKRHPDIEMVLMDVMMPVMDGYEATRAIRANSAWQKLPILALTAKAMKGDREKCLEVGMSDYISKPVNIDQLLSLMRIWLYK
jgi:CheY-like chemotaxis protein/methyl-accepting chemotaxis protein